MAELIPFVLLLGLMWFLLIRPQQSRLRKQRELVSSIEVGQLVLTAGGLIGTVRVLTDDELHLEVSPGVEVRMVRAAVTRRLDGPDGAVDLDDGLGDDGPGEGDDLDDGRGQADGGAGADRGAEADRDDDAPGGSNRA